MKKILILTLLLAILTIGAVSAADSEVNNATYDEALSVPEADEAIDEIEDDVLSAPDGVANDDEIEDDVLSAPDEGKEVFKASEGEDVLGNPLSYYTYFPTRINIDYGYLVDFGSLSNYDYKNLPYGNITITIDGVEYYNGQISPWLSVYVSDLNKRPSLGTHTINYYYSSDYDSFNKTYEVDFVYNFYFDWYMDSRTREVVFDFYLPTNADGYIDFSINNKSRKRVQVVPNLKVPVSIDELNLGLNNITAYYSGDSFYTSREITEDFRLYPFYSNPYSIIDGEDAYVSIIVPKYVTGSFDLYMDFTDYSNYYYYDDIEIIAVKINSSEVVDGTATIKMPKFEGEQRFILNFTWDNIPYEYGFYSRQINSTPMVQANVTEEVKEGQNVHLKILNIFDSIVYIDVEVDGQVVLSPLILINETDISIPDLSVGNHTIVLRSDSYRASFLKKFTITVKENEDLKPVDNPAGTSTGNDANSNADNKVSNKISLSLKTVKVKKSAKKVILMATLKINGKAAKSKTVTFKFNGKTYKVKTNSKGVAKLTVKKSVLKKLKAGKTVKYQVAYSNKLVKKTATVKK